MSEEHNFEVSFARLEQILERLNAGKVSLDESLKLYEEADQLLRICHTRLVDAETRIEILLKNREGGLTLGAQDRPEAQLFQPQE